MTYMQYVVVNVMYIGDVSHLSLRESHHSTVEIPLLKFSTVEDAFYVVGVHHGSDCANKTS